MEILKTINHYDSLIESKKELINHYVSVGNFGAAEVLEIEINWIYKKIEAV